MEKYIIFIALDPDQVGLNGQLRKDYGKMKKGVRII